MYMSVSGRVVYKNIMMAQSSGRVLIICVTVLRTSECGSKPCKFETRPPRLAVLYLRGQRPHGKVCLENSESRDQYVTGQRGAGAQVIGT